MRTEDSPLVEVRMEIVTRAFVAAGRPDGMSDLGGVTELLNNGTLAHHIALRNASVRPLYRSGLPLLLDAPILVRRDEIIFVNFEGPHFVRGAIRPPEIDVPVLLLAPPFQIQGRLMMPPEADHTQLLRAAMQTFFVVRHAQVFDAEGNTLGEGEQIIVNGAAVVMTSATAAHIPAISESAAPLPTDDERVEIVTIESEEDAAFRAA